MVHATIAAPLGVKVGIHAHNDTGLAVANSLAAVRGGATLVQGCVNGYGERTGNADIMTVIGNLQVKMGHQCIHPERMRLLTPVARDVALLCGQPKPTAHPYVGTSAFAHKGGIHVAAVRKLPHSYNHMEPTLVGNAMRTVVSELSGKGNVLSAAEKSGLVLDQDAATSLLARIKKLEQDGYSFEGADASVDMMIQRNQPNYVQPFQVLEWSVISQNRGAGVDDTNQALVKVAVGAAALFLRGPALPCPARSVCSRLPPLLPPSPRRAGRRSQGRSRWAASMRRKATAR